MRPSLTSDHDDSAVFRRSGGDTDSLTLGSKKDLLSGEYHAKVVL